MCIRDSSGTAFKIGGTGPLTGAAAIYGNACKNGAQIAVDEINAEGGDIPVSYTHLDVYKRQPHGYAAVYQPPV